MCAHRIFSYSHLTKLYLTLEGDCRCSLENGHCNYELVTNLVKQSVLSVIQMFSVEMKPWFAHGRLHSREWSNIQT